MKCADCDKFTRHCYDCVDTLVEERNKLSEALTHIYVLTTNEHVTARELIRTMKKIARDAIRDEETKEEKHD